MLIRSSEQKSELLLNLLQEEEETDLKVTLCLEDKNVKETDEVDINTDNVDLHVF